MPDQQDPIKAAYYPESSELPDPPGDLRGSVAVCLSGGGSRACTAAMGQLRGLHHLNLLNKNKIKCISSVSGGTWASILYTFRPPVIDADTFLGGVVEDPERLTWDDHSTQNKAEVLDYLDYYNLGMVPTRLGIRALLKTMIELYAKYKYPASLLWIRTIGKLVLEPFGLSAMDAKGNPLEYMGYTQDWLQENPIKLNPGRLSIGDFNAVPDDPLRPFLITNTAVFSDSSTLNPFVISPVYEGIFNTLHSGEGIFGGGLLDTYAFGSRRPQKLTGNQVSVQQMPTRACLADAAGLSSAFFASILEGKILEANGDIFSMHEFKDLGFLEKDFHELSKTVADIDDLIPEFAYWPVGDLSTEDPETRTVKFADGGNLENSGIMPLLQRSCTSIISFINSMTPLEENDQGLTVDSVLPPLFGYCPSKKGGAYKRYADMTENELGKLSNEDQIYRDNQVFPSTDFYPLLNQLAAASKGANGVLGSEPVLCVQNLTTLENPKFGIAAGLSTKVLWVYNNPVESWRRKLTRQIRWMMNMRILDYNDFPNYNTITKIHLDARQVNLLAHLSCWKILQNEELILSMWD